MSDNAEDEAPKAMLSPPPLLKKVSLSLLPQASGASAQVAKSTTAVVTENVEPTEITSRNEDSEVNSLASPKLRPSRLKLASIVDSESVAHLVSETEELVSEEDESETNHLTELLHNLMAHDVGKSRTLGSSSLLHSNIVSGEDGEIDEEYISSRILPDKLDSSEKFHAKLKQVFVLSSAGKPIYSLNGSDDTVMGYMGIITTIISTYQENMKAEFNHIAQGGFRLVVMNKSPLILVLISRVAYELELAPVNQASALERQLSSVYDQIVSVLSAPVIKRNFEGRMNYDLRKVLSSQDFAFLDALVMKMTYGFSVLNDEQFHFASSAYISHLLDSSLRCVRITHSTRSKFNSILLSTKKLTVKEGISDTASIISRATVSESKRYLANDLLFGFICMNEEVLSHVRLSQHKLPNRDINLLLSTISFQFKSGIQEDSAELWVPLCMPNFNDSGFLYAYVRTFEIKDYDEPLSLILVGANKNSFFDLKQVGQYIVSKILRNKSLVQAFSSDIARVGNILKLVESLNCPFIKHFIYRRKAENQYFMDDINFLRQGNDKYQNVASYLQLLYFYTALHNSKSTSVRGSGESAKKLTYIRWQKQEGWITGFLLSSKHYDFYCLCGGSIQAQEIIEQSLKIIKWVEKYKKRFFIGDGITF